MAAVRGVLYGWVAEPGPAGPKASGTGIINLDAGFAVDF
jgi:hypothetical protein